MTSMARAAQPVQPVRRSSDSANCEYIQPCNFDRLWICFVAYSIDVHLFGALPVSIEHSSMKAEACGYCAKLCTCKQRLRMSYCS